MNFTNLKYKLGEWLEDAYNNIAESALVFKIKEKYFGLSNKTRVSLKWSFKTLAFIFIFYMPLSYFFKASNTLNYFKKQKLIIKDLKTLDSNLNNTLLDSLQDDLSRSLNGWILSLNLLAEQKSPIRKEKSSFSQISKDFKVQTYSVQFTKLNLKQLLDLSNQIENISPNIKVYKLEINEESEMENYFSVRYFVSKIIYKSQIKAKKEIKKKIKKRSPPKKVKRNKIKKREKALHALTPKEEKKEEESKLPKLKKNDSKQNGPKSLRELYKLRRKERNKKINEKD